MILVTVGTEQYPFNALMDWVDALIRYRFVEGDEEIVVQYGSSSRLPNQVQIYQRLPESEFRSLAERARIVIAHCGEGTALLLETLDKPYILVPRAQLFGEHVDNHQLEMAEAMEKQGVPIARSPGDLVRFLAAPKLSTRVLPSDTNLCQLLLNHYDVQQHSKLMLVCSSGGHFTAMQALKPFWGEYPEVSWVTFRTASTEAELSSRSDSVYWAYSPTNRNIPNLIRNLVLSLGILRQERPAVVASTGAGVAVPFLLIAKFFYGSKVVFIESKTRLQHLSLSARILQVLSAVDLLVVRSQELAERYPEAVWADAPIGVAPTISRNADPGSSVVQFKETALLRAPQHFGAQAVDGFVQSVRDLCAAHPKAIVVDLSATASIDGAGLGALLAALKLTRAIGCELALWSVAPRVMSVLLRARFNRLFKIEAATATTRTAAALEYTPQLKIPATVQTPMQRGADIAAAILGLIVLTLLFLPIAIAIQLESAGPLFISQNRTANTGKRFRVWKFRTTASRADVLEGVQPETDHSGLESQTTVVGRFLRQTQLDKLPFCLNVLTGTMSLFELRTPSLEDLDFAPSSPRSFVAVKPVATGEWPTPPSSSLEDFEDRVSLSNTTGS